MNIETNPICKLRNLSEKILQKNVNVPSSPQNIATGHLPSADLLDSLADEGALPEAVRLLSYALPEREAVWWACMCVRHAVPLSALAPEQEAAVVTSEDWVRRQSFEARIEAHAASAKAGYTTPAAWVARAAFATPETISVPTRTGRKVERATFLAAVYGEAEHPTERLRRFIASGRDIARGGAGRLPPATG
jgi:hypothetical protein